jgi:hypothetical protein
LKSSNGKSLTRRTNTCSYLFISLSGHSSALLRHAGKAILSRHPEAAT